MKECVDLDIGIVRCLLVLEELPHELALVFVHIFPARTRVLVHGRAAGMAKDSKLRRKSKEEVDGKVKNESQATPTNPNTDIKKGRA